MQNPRLGTITICEGVAFPSLNAVARHYGINRCTIRKRLDRGMTIEEAVRTPVRKQRRSRRASDGRRLCVNCRRPIDVTGNKWGHCIPCTRRYQVEHKHRVPRGTYVALWERQRGKCRCCGQSLRNLTQRAPHIDHCHETGVIRGLLCHYCNTALGMVRESRENALALAEYIRTCCEPVKSQA